MHNKILITIGAIIFIAFCTISILYVENHQEIYYTKIDNTKIEKLSTRDTMKFEYTLESYNKNGHKKTLSFKTRRKLKENAYIALNVRTLGVYKWEEVDYDDLTKIVKEKLND